MAKQTALRTTIVLLLFLSGCATGSLTKDDKFVPEKWRTLAVLPFTGADAFDKTTAEFFAFQLERQKHFQIVAPAKTEITLKRSGTVLASDGLTAESAQKVGRVIGADALIVGKITLHRFRDLTSVEVRLIDVATGQVIASVVQSALGMVRGPAYAQYVRYATERAAADMMAVLEELSTKRRGVKEE